MGSGFGHTLRLDSLWEGPRDGSVRKKYFCQPDELSSIPGPHTGKERSDSDKLTSDLYRGSMAHEQKDFTEGREWPHSLVEVACTTQWGHPMEYCFDY